MSRSCRFLVALATAGALPNSGWQGHTAHAQSIVTISHVDEHPVSGGTPALVGNAASVAVRGMARLPARPEMVTAQLAVRRVYDGMTFLSESARLDPPPGKSQDSSWLVPSVQLPKPDLGRGWQISVVITRDGALPSGATDDETIRRVALSRSGEMHIASGPEPLRTVPDGACAIEITAIRDVSGEMRAPGSGDIEVGLSSEVSGTFDMPVGVHEYLGVKPASSNSMWLMGANRTRAGRKWRGTAYTGREGLDFGELFVVKAWLLRQPVEEDRQYDAKTWAGIEKSACAASSDVVVRRRVGPGDLKITQVDDSAVNGRHEPIQINPESDVSGQIEDMQPAYALKPAETVWILTRAVGSEGWLVAALAVVQDDRLSWRAPAVRFRRPGEHQVSAVAAVTNLRIGRTLSADDWFALARANLVRRISRTVTVLSGR